MKKIIDLQTFQKITTDCMRVHETFRSTEPLTAEAERILQLADSLLRQAGLAYLNEGQNLDLPSVPNSEQQTRPEEVVENFIGVQHALADLKQALYQVLKTHVAEQRWSELETSFNALISLGEKGVDVSSVVNAVEDAFIQLMQTQVAGQRWPELATSLNALSSLGKEGPGVSKVANAMEDPFIQLVRTHVAKQRWSELETLFNALSSLGKKEPKVSEVVDAIDSSMAKAIEDTFIPQAKELFKSKKWDEGRTLLRSWLFSPKIRSCYYISYIDQSYVLKNNQQLIELRSQLGKKSSDYSDLKHAISMGRIGDAKDLSDIRTEVNQIVLHHNFKPTQVL